MKRSRPIPKTPQEYRKLQTSYNLKPGDCVLIVNTKATDEQIQELGINWDNKKRKAIGQTHIVTRAIYPDQGILLELTPDPLGLFPTAKRYYPCFMLKKI